MLVNIKLDCKKFVLLQVFLVVSGYVLVISLYGFVYANSFLMGALLMLAANFIFFFRLFIGKQFSPTVEILVFYMSEFLKLCIVAVVTVILAVYIKPKLFAYIFGLVLLQLVVCFVPILTKKVR